MEGHMKGGSLYFVSDKSVHDALVQHRFKKSDLSTIFLNRGIIVSPQTSREEVASYFSTLNHDFYDHNMIANVFASNPRKEKTSVTSIFGNVSREGMDSALKD